MIPFRLDGSGGFSTTGVILRHETSVVYKTERKRLTPLFLFSSTRRTKRSVRRQSRREFVQGSEKAGSEADQDDNMPRGQRRAANLCRQLRTTRKRRCRR